MENNNEFAVVTINAGGARRERMTSLNPQQIGNDLKKMIGELKITPAIIAAQESHRGWFSGDALHRDISEEFAKSLGTSYRSFFSPYLDSDYHAHQRKWEKPAFEGYNRLMQGNAIITNMEVGNWPWTLPAPKYPGHGQLTPISTQISKSSVYSTGNRDTEPRNLVVVPLKLKEDMSLYFMATHLTTLSGENRHDRRSLRSQEASAARLEQAQEILRILDELRTAEQEYGFEPRPVILAGDFNAAPGSPEINELEKAFFRPQPRWGQSSSQMVWTHTKYKIHIDHIFYNDPDGLLTPIDCFIPDPSYVGGVTDHLPVVAKFKL